MDDEIKFNLFNLVLLISENIKKIILILLICFVASFYFFKTQKINYTATFEIDSLAEIQNEFKDINFSSNQLLKLFSYRFFHFETIQNSLNIISKNQKNIILPNEVYDMSSLLPNENEDGLIIKITNSDKIFISKYINVHIDSVKKDMIKYLRYKIDNQIYINKLLLDSKSVAYERQRLAAKNQVNNELNKLQNFYSEEKNNTLDYLRQNRNLASAMNLELPVASITSEHAEIISNSKPAVSNKIQDLQTNFGNNSSILSVQDIVKNDILLGIPAYLFGTKMLDQLIASIENKKLAEINEIFIILQKQLFEIKKLDDFDNKKVKLDMDLENAKSRFNEFNYIISSGNFQLFNFNNIIEYKDNKISLTLMLIIGFIVGVIISILFIIPYRKLVNENK